MAEEFYMQDTRNQVGNSMLWWAKGGCGYVCDIRQAEIWSRKDAEAQHRMRSTDRPWPKAYIDARIKHHVDFQGCDLTQICATCRDVHDSGYYDHSFTSDRGGGK